MGFDLSSLLSQAGGLTPQGAAANFAEAAIGEPITSRTGDVRVGPVSQGGLNFNAGSSQRDLLVAGAIGAGVVLVVVLAVRPQKRRRK